MTKQKTAKRGRPIPAACPTGKRSYARLALARQASRASQKIRGAPLTVYKCDTIYPQNGDTPEPGCGQYHLTTRRKG